MTRPVAFLSRKNLTKQESQGSAKDHNFKINIKNTYKQYYQPIGGWSTPLWRLETHERGHNQAFDYLPEMMCWQRRGFWCKRKEKQPQFNKYNSFIIIIITWFIHIILSIVRYSCSNWCWYMTLFRAEWWIGSPVWTK